MVLAEVAEFYGPRRLYRVVLDGVAILTPGDKPDVRRGVFQATERAVRGYSEDIAWAVHQAARGFRVADLVWQGLGTPGLGYGRLRYKVRVWFGRGV